MGTRGPWRTGMLLSIGLAMLACAPAASAIPESLNTAGSLTYTWQASKALGCAQARLCGVHGAVGVSSDGAEYVRRHRQLMLAVNSATARTAGPGLTESCADVLPLELVLLRVRGGFAHVGAADGVPSAGRCAGPLQSDIERLAIPVRRRGGRQGSFSLEGTETTTAGPFVLRVRAAMSLTPGGGGLDIITAGGSGGTPPAPLRSEQAVLSYQVQPSSSALVAHFRTAPAPFCDPLGACDTTGTIAVSILGGGRALKLSLTRPVLHPVSRAQILRALHAGRLGGGGTGEVLVSVTETIDTGGQVSCASTRMESVPLEVVPNASREAVGLIGEPDGAVSFGTSDVLRTYCPGPDDADLTDIIALIGRGAVPAARLGSPTLAVTLRHHARFRNLDYSGGWSGPLRFRLRLSGVRVGITNRPVRVLSR